MPKLRISGGVGLRAGTSQGQFLFWDAINNVWTPTGNILLDANGNIDLQSNNIVNLADPVNPQDAVTMIYVDAKEVETFPTSLLAGSVIFSNGVNLTQDNSELFWDDTNKRLGIGVNTPVYKLDVISGTDNMVANFESTDANALITFHDNTTVTNRTAIGAIGTRMALFTGGSERISILTGGKVGIGTSSPDSAFHIKASVPGLVGSHFAGQLIIQSPTDSVTSNVVITAYESDGSGNPDQQLWYLGSSAAANSDITFLNRRNAKLALGTNGISRMTILGNGNVGIGTTNPTTMFSVNEKSGNTSIGGFAIKLTNKTGVNSVAGKLVQADTTQNDAVKLTDTDEEETFGVFLDSGIADGAEAWVVVSGIADVAMEDNTTATRGNWVRSSVTEAGYADATNAAPPSPAAFSHFNEIGNCIETVTATGEGTNILARCVLHFN